MKTSPAPHTIVSSGLHRRRVGTILVSFAALLTDIPVPFLLGYLAPPVDRTPRTVSVLCFAAREIDNRFAPNSGMAQKDDLAQGVRHLTAPYEPRTARLDPEFQIPKRRSVERRPNSGIARSTKRGSTRAHALSAYQKTQ
jgi:hypothetical protein